MRMEEESGRGHEVNPPRAIEEGVHLACLFIHIVMTDLHVFWQKSKGSILEQCIPDDQQFCVN